MTHEENNSLVLTSPYDAADRRRLYIQLSLKRVRPGAGSSAEFLRSRTWRQAVFPLASLISVPFVVVGGVATRLYAAERMTETLDVLVLREDAAHCYQQLAEAKAKRIGSLSVGGSEWRLPDGTTLDVLESDDPWAREAVTSSVAAPGGLPVISLPYLVLMKMIASRGIDIGDLTRMLGGADEGNLKQVWRVIRVHLPDALEDLESLILLGRLEQQQTDTRLTPDE